MCSWFTPAPLQQHKPYFTILFALTCCIVFAAMVGQFPATATKEAACVAHHVGPAALVAWITGKVG